MVQLMADEVRQAIAAPTRLWSRDEVAARPSPVPDGPGIYGCYFNEVPCDADIAGCATNDGATLLYVGITPKEQPPAGRAPSTQALRSRILYHYRGNAYGSTLRLTLGVLLRERLGISLQRVGGGRATFGPGEDLLSAWMAENAFVTFASHPEPWIAKHDLIRDLDLPLNLVDNRDHPYWPTLTARRAAAQASVRPAR